MLRLIFVGAVAVWPVLGLAEERQFDLGGFDQVEVRRGVETDIVLGQRFEVVAVARSGSFENLVLQVTGNVLEIKAERQRRIWGLWGLLTRERLGDYKVLVTLPSLEHVSASSGADVRVLQADQGLKSARSSSGASLVLEEGTFGRLRLSSSSGARLQAGGTCQQLVADASSGARLDAGALTCHHARLAGSSGSELRAFADDTAEAQSSSGAHVRLDGGATITARETSSGGQLSVN